MLTGLSVIYSFYFQASVINKLLASKSHQLTSPITYSTMPCSLSCHGNSNSCGNNNCNKKNNSSSNIHTSNNAENSDIKNYRLEASNVHKQLFSNSKASSEATAKTTTASNKTPTTISTTTNKNSTTAINEAKVVKPPIAVFTSKNKSKTAHNRTPTSTTTNNNNNNINNKNNNKNNELNNKSIPNKHPLTPQPQQKSFNLKPPIQPNISNSNNNNTFNNNNTPSNNNNPNSNSNTPPITSLCAINSLETFASRKLVTMRGLRQLYVIKHGESIESTFGKDWVDNSFNQGLLHPLVGPLHLTLLLSVPRLLILKQKIPSPLNTTSLFTTHRFINIHRFVPTLLVSSSLTTHLFIHTL